MLPASTVDCEKLTYQCFVEFPDQGSHQMSHATKL